MLGRPAAHDPLERRCRLLLRAYPAWYRHERADEILDTLLEASAPGRNCPTFHDARALVSGGLRVRGWTWFLANLWAGLGAAGAGYEFILSTHVPEAAYIGLPSWVGEPGVAYLAGDLGALAWVLLTIPVAVARVGPTPANSVGWAGWWAIGWAAGLALAYPVANWQPSAPAVWTCSKNEGCALAGYKYAVVSWGELAVFAGWLALGAAMMLILAKPDPRRARSVPDGTVRGT